MSPGLRVKDKAQSDEGLTFSLLHCLLAVRAGTRQPCYQVPLSLVYCTVAFFLKYKKKENHRGGLL